MLQLLILASSSEPIYSMVSTLVVPWSPWSQCWSRTEHSWPYQNQWCCALAAAGDWAELSEARTGRWRVETRVDVTHCPYDPRKTTFLNPQGPKRTLISEESFGATWEKGSCDSKPHSPKNEVSIHKKCPSAFTSSGCSQDSPTAALTSTSWLCAFFSCRVLDAGHQVNKNRSPLGRRLPQLL